MHFITLSVLLHFQWTQVQIFITLLGLLHYREFMTLSGSTSPNLNVDTIEDTIATHSSLKLGVRTHSQMTRS